MGKISENTTITLGIAALFAGGLLWLSSMYSEVRANAETVKEIQTDQREYIAFVRSIDARLSRIEGYLEVKKGK